MKMKPYELRDALTFTAGKTGFSPSLIEKDYYCSLVIKSIYEDKDLKNLLIFKGGTLLAKGYFEFFRLSEDLDFSVNNLFYTNRTERRKIAEKVRHWVKNILNQLGFKEVSPFRGFNESTQYNGVFGYDSVTGPSNIIKFEIGFREDLLLNPINMGLQTLLENPLTEKRLFPILESLVLSKEEAFAEKVRAALTRKQPAIRDFFDLEKIFQSGFDVLEEKFIDIVKKKIFFDSSAVIDLSFEKTKILEAQIETDLKPVLKTGVHFTLKKSWECAQSIAKYLN